MKLTRYEAESICYWERESGRTPNLSGENMSWANLSGANLSGASLSRANLSGASLSRANLSGANLYKANLSRANLCDANLYKANLSGANLYKANLSEAEITGIVGDGKRIISGQNVYKWALIDGKELQIGCEKKTIDEWEYLKTHKDDLWEKMAVQFGMMVGFMLQKEGVE